MVFVLLSIFVPIIVDIFVFGNSCESNINNESWASFLGSFLGAIIGGGCTCWAVIMQKYYADKQRQIDEIASIRPYIIAEMQGCVKRLGNIDINFTIRNIGLNSACDIEIFAFNLDWDEERRLIDKGKHCLTVNSAVAVHPNFNFVETMYYEFHYTDLKGNRYYQDFRYDEFTNSFVSMEPIRAENVM